MAKPLVFLYAGAEIAFEMNKVDRAKLYGYKEVEILDEDGDKCEMATLADDGHTIVGKGGTGLGYLSADGKWCEKSDLRPVDLNGVPIAPVGSSFSAPVPLGQQTTVADYLDHIIRSVYLMTANSESPLITELKNGTIYKFPYSFRGGLESDIAFLLANDKSEIYMAVGSSTTVSFVGLQQVAGVVGDEAEAVEEETDDMDFGMI